MGKIEQVFKPSDCFLKFLIGLDSSKIHFMVPDNLLNEWLNDLKDEPLNDLLK